MMKFVELRDGILVPKSHESYIATRFSDGSMIAVPWGECYIHLENMRLPVVPLRALDRKLRVIGYEIPPDTPIPYEGVVFDFDDETLISRGA